MILESFHLIVFSLVLLPSYSFAKKNPMISSSEEIAFLSKSEKALLDLGKTKSFIGVLSRREVSKADKEHLDLYDFPVVPEKISSAMCVKLLENVFGPSNKIFLKIEGTEFFKNSLSQNICEVTLSDSDKNALFKEHRFFAFNAGDKTIGLVSHLNKKANKDEIEELRKFVKSLRIRK